MYDVPFLLHHVCHAISNAFGNTSNLPQDALSIEGMSGSKTRHLYNNICNLQGATYLEVGAWKGSSFVSAMYANPIKGYCVDNWSEFGGQDEFLFNVKTWLADRNITVLDKNCWDVGPSDLPDPVDIYLYDGAHSYADQKKAITHFAQFLAKYAILIIDDWMCEWAGVRKGTLDGLADAGLKVHFSCEIPLVNTSANHTGGDTFWNGCGIFVVEKLCDATEPCDAAEPCAEYTSDWFTSSIDCITRTLSAHPAPTQILEIGSWEGRSACWFLETFPDASITCVDTFQGSGAEHAEFDVAGIKARFLKNTAYYRNRVTLCEGCSSKVLYGLVPESFDCIYIDGSHQEDDVLTDLVLAFGLLRPGGVLLVDDYNNATFPGVRKAVDKFAMTFSNRLRSVLCEYQVHFVKT